VTDEGRALFFYGTANGLDDVPMWLTLAPVAEAHFGWSVASAGDVDGDGRSDVVLGAPGYRVTAEEQGLALVVLGDGLAYSFLYWFRILPYAHAGQSVSTAGDVNGDGYSDVLVGAPSASDSTIEEGAALAYLSNEGRGSWIRAPQQRRVFGTAPIAVRGRS